MTFYLPSPLYPLCPLCTGTTMGKKFCAKERRNLFVNLGVIYICTVWPNKTSEHERKSWNWLVWWVNGMTYIMPLICQQDNLMNALIGQQGWFKASDWSLWSLMFPEKALKPKGDECVSDITGFSGEENKSNICSVLPYYIFFCWILFSRGGHSHIFSRLRVNID